MFTASLLSLITISIIYLIDIFSLKSKPFNIATIAFITHSVILIVSGLLFHNIISQYRHYFEKLTEKSNQLQAELLKQNAYRKELQNFKSRYRTIFNSVTDAIIIFEELTLSIISANKQMKKISGYPDEILYSGKNSLNFLDTLFFFSYNSKDILSLTMTQDMNRERQGPINLTDHTCGLRPMSNIL